MTEKLQTLEKLRLEKRLYELGKTTVAQVAVDNLRRELQDYTNYQHFDSNPSMNKQGGENSRSVVCRWDFAAHAGLFFDFTYTVSTPSHSTSTVFTNAARLIYAPAITDEQTVSDIEKIILAQGFSRKLT
ncbi:Uncharacterised protein [uncultured archaeon]|nr:Uncharacterised protein [uncultured archaeon]